MHRRHQNRSVPVGAPTFFDPRPGGSPASHAALDNCHGKMVTTHASTNRIGIDTVALWESFGDDYLGWTSRLHGVALPVGRVMPTVRQDSRNVTVKVLKQRMAAHGFAPTGRSASWKRGDGSKLFGKELDDLVRAFQKESDQEIEGVAGDDTWTALMKG
ncbi:putative peptidoglycan binding domain-containing protein [Isoptericola jiangsuensis]|uniref:Putative peptidoglycan binding domain-containing protein n=1 Tax=Isoptericola jiangsuensis TaxID=548579 RepID=A0A2A9EWV3_9MICO|nr:peptidoglycan-binding domain-containing protein [Isoptericola jiangsuensis]PFG43348.1 putative peptidoglycan binding domain-containing protein [Isoptericola jiangsuensis]